MSKATDSIAIPAESSHKCDICDERATHKMTNCADLPRPIWHHFCEKHGQIYWDAHCVGAVRSDKPSEN